MEQKINSMSQWSRMLRGHGGQLVAERDGEMIPVREQHAPFLFINEMLASGGPLSVLITNESVVVSITRATEMSNII